MTLRRIELRGESFVTLATAAECFRLEIHFVEEVYATGALGNGERVGDAIAIADGELDRLAAIVRWHRHFGVDLMTVVAFLRS